MNGNFDWGKILPILLIGGVVAYFALSGGGVSALPGASSTAEKAKKAQAKADHYAKLAKTLEALARKEEELKALKGELSNI